MRRRMRTEEEDGGGGGRREEEGGGRRGEDEECESVPRSASPIASPTHRRRIDVASIARHWRMEDPSLSIAVYSRIPVRCSLYLQYNRTQAR